MEQATPNDNGLRWRLTEPDEDGCVWLEWRGEGPPERLNLGADEPVSETLARWLEQRDFGER